MNLHDAKHPDAIGQKFKGFDAEIRWAYGKRSSADFDELAHEATEQALAAANEIADLLPRWRHFAAIANDEGEAKADRSEAKIMAQIIGEAVEKRTHGLRFSYERADELLSLREQARRFEERFNFDVYADSWRDKFEAEAQKN